MNMPRTAEIVSMVADELITLIENNVQFCTDDEIENIEFKLVDLNYKLAKIRTKLACNESF